MDQEHKIAARFREVRQVLGLTQQELADRLLVSRNYVAKIETAKKEPSTRVLRSLEGLLVDREYNQASDRWTLAETEKSNIETLGDEIRALFERTLRAAHGNERHLIWMLEQMRAHLQPPAHWPREKGEDPPENPAVRAAREAGTKKGFAKLGKLLAEGERPSEDVSHAV